jgi:hypothetical protein
MKTPAMDTVAFLSIESGKDLIVSFAVMVPNDPTEIESLTLLRTPVYEPLLEEWERGVSVSFERYDDEEDWLEEVQWDKQGAVIRLKTRRRSYQLDLRKVDRNDQSAMRKVLKKMNYDRRIPMSGV